LKEMGRYIGLPHFSQAQRRPIDRPARTKRVNPSTKGSALGSTFYETRSLRWNLL